MKRFPLLIALAPLLAFAESPSEPGEDALFEILRDTTGGPPQRGVTVVLEDEEKPLAKEAKPQTKVAPDPKRQAAPIPAELVSMASASAKHDPQKGVAVRVETLQAGSAPIDPQQVKLLAPFPAKPLSEAPRGWALDSSGNTPPFIKEVELAPGTKISLSIKPHLLVPVVNGTTLFNVNEPGFEAALGYQQSQTLGSILSTSIEQLDEDAKKLGGMIDRLQQLLVSLPSEEPESTMDSPSTPAPKEVQPLRKR